MSDFFDPPKYRMKILRRFFCGLSVELDRSGSLIVVVEKSKSYRQNFCLFCPCFTQLDFCPMISSPEQSFLLKIKLSWFYDLCKSFIKKPQLAAIS